MGLDMYAYTAPKEMVGDKQTDLNSLLFEDGKARDGVNTDFAYWRKFNNLHNWMCERYYMKGGQSDVFNCVTLRLMDDDLDELLASAPTLKPATGFFWGDAEDMTPEDIEEVTDFVKQAKAAIAGGQAVMYDSWW